MSSPVSYELRDNIALILVDNPPVNALSQPVRQGIKDGFQRFMKDEAAAAAVIAGAGRTFIAGADIKEFGKPLQEPNLTNLIQEMEDCDKPVICALHGTALGGGFETALACHYRVALASAKVGLPEVHLGLIPGAGGTQRTTRLAGADMAVDMVTSGRHVKAREAMEAGLIDEVDEGDDPVAIGIAYAKRLLANEEPVRRSSELEDKIAGDRGNKEKFDAIRAAVKKKARGQLSPVTGVDAVQAAVEMPFAEGILRERELFRGLMETDQRKGMIHAFFADRQVAKIPEAGKADPRPLKKLGVIGGGTMGSGISVAALNAGLAVQMVERDAEGIERGRGNVDRLLSDGVRRGLLSQDAKDKIMGGQYQGSTDMADLADCDLIIEAAFEDMDIKKDLFRQLDKVCKPGAVLASNTSYLNIDELAAETSRPEDVLGLHFFSPAHIMKLLEVVVGAKTAVDVTNTGFALAKAMRKIGVRAGVCDGFIGNRILANYLEATAIMMEDGASPYEIDNAVTNFGLPMGPFTMGDMAGLDIGWMTRKRKAATRDPAIRYTGDIGDRICELGRYGQKTGRGYYIYEEGARRGVEDPEVLEIINDVRMKKQIIPRSFSEEDIIRRYMAAMINEAAKVVEEGIALRPLDVDITKLYGYGFPRWRGGPMKYADIKGLDSILADIREFETEAPNVYAPAQLIVDLVARGDNFDSLNK